MFKNPLSSTLCLLMGACVLVLSACSDKSSDPTPKLSSASFALELISNSDALAAVKKYMATRGWELDEAESKAFDKDFNGSQGSAIVTEVAQPDSSYSVFALKATTLKLLDSTGTQKGSDLALEGTVAIQNRLNSAGVSTVFVVVPNSQSGEISPATPTVGESLTFIIDTALVMVTNSAAAKAISNRSVGNFSQIAGVANATNETPNFLFTVRGKGTSGISRGETGETACSKYVNCSTSQNNESCNPEVPASRTDGKVCCHRNSSSPTQDPTKGGSDWTWLPIEKCKLNCGTAGGTRCDNSYSQTCCPATNPPKCLSNSDVCKQDCPPATPVWDEVIGKCIARTCDATTQKTCLSGACCGNTEVCMTDGSCQCPSGAVVTIDGKCQCSANQEILNGKCVERCSPGQVRKSDGTCNCPEGQEIVNGQCVAKCSEGQTRLANGICACPGQTELIGDRCQCPKNINGDQLASDGYNNCVLVQDHGQCPDILGSDAHPDLIVGCKNENDPFGVNPNPVNAPLEWCCLSWQKCGQSSGQCVPDQSKCEPSETLDENGNCKPKCNLPQVYTNGVCQCPEGQISDGVGGCKSSCPAPFIYANGKCDCPDSMESGVDIVNGQEVRWCRAVTCPANSTYSDLKKTCVCSQAYPQQDGKGGCMACPVDKPKWNGATCEACPASSHWNAVSNRCEICSINSTWDATAQMCYCDKDYHIQVPGGLCQRCSYETPQWNATAKKCEACPLGTHSVTAGADSNGNIIYSCVDDPSPVGPTPTEAIGSCKFSSGGEWCEPNLTQTACEAMPEGKWEENGICPTSNASP